MLITSAESTSSIASIISQYLPKDNLACTDLVIYLKMDLSEKFNLNLGYILIRASSFDNQDNTLYRISY